MSGARFLTRDPIEAVTRSAYGYAGNNPTNRTDPTGLEWWDPNDWSADDIWDATGGNAVTAVDDASSWLAARIDTSAGCGFGPVGLAVGQQGGNGYVQRTNGVMFGCGLNIGLTSRRFEDRECTSMTGAISPPDGVGGYGQIGRNKGGGLNLRDIEGGVSFGPPGFAFGQTRTYDGKSCTGVPFSIIELSEDDC